MNLTFYGGMTIAKARKLADDLASASHGYYERSDIVIRPIPTLVPEAVLKWSRYKTKKNLNASPRASTHSRVVSSRGRASGGFHVIVPGPLDPRHEAELRAIAKRYSDIIEMSASPKDMIDADTRERILADMRWLLAKFDVKGKLKNRDADPQAVVDVHKRILKMLTKKYGWRNVDQALRHVTAFMPRVKKPPLPSRTNDSKFAFAFQGGSRVANPTRLHEDLEPEACFKLAEHFASVFNRKSPPRGRRITLDSLDLEELRTLQPTIDQSVVDSYTPSKLKRKPLRVARIHGKLTIIDGNHALIAHRRNASESAIAEEFTLCE